MVNSDPLIPFFDSKSPETDSNRVKIDGTLCEHCPTAPNASYEPEIFFLRDVMMVKSIVKPG